MFEGVISPGYTVLLNILYNIQEEENCIVRRFDYMRYSCKY